MSQAAPAPGASTSTGAAAANGTVCPGGRRLGRHALVLAAAAFVLVLALYLTDLATHPLGMTLTWFDLNIYHRAGLLTRHATGTLYTWQFKPGVRYLYTPFAAIGLAAASLLPWGVLTWLTTAASIAAMAATAWWTVRQLGWRGRDRAALALAVAAAGLLTEPVLRCLQVGQVELLLTALVVWDLCQPEDRRWKGLGIGIAAGIKLVPLIFIPYLLLAGKRRQAVVATGVFLATVTVGFAVLPHDSVKWWLTGYFLHAGNFANIGLGSLPNQSVLALITRTPAGTGSVTGLWLLAAAVTGVVGLTAAAVLARSGRLTAGWVTCAVTGVLVSPISWDNHWVWIVPVLALLASQAAAGRGAARWGALVLAGALAGVFGAWPQTFGGPYAKLAMRGLLGGFPGRRHSKWVIFHLHGTQLLTWNLYVLAGLAIFGGLLIAAVRVYRAAWPPLDIRGAIGDRKYLAGARSR
jgi:alpha-1,2-mannosyltransferase